MATPGTTPGSHQFMSHIYHVTTSQLTYYSEKYTNTVIARVVQRDKIVPRDGIQSFLSRCSCGGFTSRLSTHDMTGRPATGALMSSADYSPLVNDKCNTPTNLRYARSPVIVTCCVAERPACIQPVDHRLLRPMCGSRQHGDATVAVFDWSLVLKYRS